MRTCVMCSVWMFNVARNTFNKPSRTANKGWYSRFRLGREDNCKTNSILGVGRDSAVGVATGYDLDGPGIESWWG